MLGKCADENISLLEHKICLGHGLWWFMES